MKPSDTPLLLIAWRRPHELKRVIDVIRPISPKNLFVACDGPCDTRPGEAELVRQTRNIISNQINWPCQMKKLYSKSNQGCRLGVSRAINWFFENVDEGIILEDDCLPHPDFFTYCSSLLDHYRNDQRIWCISGSNFQNGIWRGDGSYYLSRYNTCWGWATWRRCWLHYDSTLGNWPLFQETGMLEAVFTNPSERLYWQNIWQLLYEKAIPDTWDWQWIFTCFSNQGLTAVPNRNLVSNIGFGPAGTHTLDPNCQSPPATALGPIRHPSFILADQRADQYFFNERHISPPPLFRSRLKRYVIKRFNKLFQGYADSSIRS